LLQPGQGTVASALRSLERADLKTLALVRISTALAQTLAVMLATRFPGELLLLVLLGATSLVFAIASLVLLERIRRNTTLEDGVFFRQILIDILVLTYLLSLSGGPSNPFHDLYVVPVTMAAATLPVAYVWRTAGVAIACYVLLEFVHLPLPAEPFVSEFLRVGELSDHVLLAILLAYFVVRMSQGLRERDRLLAEAHEREIRAGCAITLGSVAAGAAHELATPLSTISTVIEELREERAERDVRNSLELLQASLHACLLCLSDLRSCGDAWMRGGEIVPADRFLAEVTKRFRELRPHVYVKQVFRRSVPGPSIVPDLALQQAIINLLNNAASVSPFDITLTASWDLESLHVQVADKGDGISPELAQRLGRVFVTTKPPETGNGIGLFLTNVTVSRLGGTLRLYNADDGGAIAEIHVPLASLQRQETTDGHLKQFSEPIEARIAAR
jgi:two-component system sensor histidine kinase RegB